MRQAKAFTIIELLVCVAIIALLMGIVLPALGRARDAARTAIELSAARQLAIGYVAHAAEQRGRLLPGYAHEPAHDGFNNPVTPPANARYPWRLARYVNHQVRGCILVNEQEKLAEGYDPASPGDWYYAISVNPSFGLNQYYLGGDLVNPGPRTWLTRLDDAARPSDLITFASARYNAGYTAAGFFRVEAPTGSINNITGWSAAYDEGASAHTWGFVHPRHDGRAAFAMLDGHAALLDTQDMRDMRRWANQAALVGDPDWTPF